MQDTILVIPPYPYCMQEVNEDVPLEDCWYACPQLLFTCYLRPTGGRLPKNASYRCGPDDLRYHLVFFSTFEELKLPISWLMERAGGDQVVLALANTLPVFGSSSQYGGQSSTDPLVPG